MKTSEASRAYERARYAARLKGRTSLDRTDHDFTIAAQRQLYGDRPYRSLTRDERNASTALAITLMRAALAAGSYRLPRSHLWGDVSVAWHYTNAEQAPKPNRWAPRKRKSA